MFEPVLDLLDDHRLVFEDEDIGRIEDRADLRGSVGQRLQFDDATGLLHQHLLLERLHNIVAYADLGDLEHVLAAALGRQHHDRDVLQLGLRLDFREHLDAVHDGHGDIEENEVRHFAGGHGEAFDAIARFRDLTVIGFERLPHDDADGLGIVDSQDFLAHGQKGDQSPLFIRISATIRWPQQSKQ